MAREIPLTRGYVAIVDDEDYERVAAHRWQFVLSKGYQRAERSWRVCGKLHHQKMAMLLMSPSPGMVVDHINGDPLDNRKANLRVCTPKQNSCNRRRLSRKAVPFKGVYARPDSTRFSAQIALDGKTTHLGTHSTAEDAARAYDAAARRLHGEFARLNFPEAA